MGGFLTIDYCLRAIGYCFPYCFLEIFVGGQGLDGGDKVAMGDPPVPPTRETLLTQCCVKVICWELSHCEFIASVFWFVTR